MSETTEMQRDFEEMERRITRLKGVERELINLATPECRRLFSTEMAAIKAKLKSPARIDEVERELEALKSLLSPQLSLSMSRTKFEPGTLSDTELRVENGGSAPAKNVAIAVYGDAEISGLRKVAAINGGETVPLPVRMKPNNAGYISLRFTLSCEDVARRQHTVEQVLTIRVEKPGEPLPLYFPGELLAIYSPIEQIGKGGFARVFRCSRKSDGRQVAVKVPIAIDTATGESFLDEIVNWKQLDHDNIIKLLAANVMPVVYLEMELADHSLEKVAKPLIVEWAAHIILEITRGLYYAHEKKEKGILHLDLKPSHILLVNNVPKITDWGLSKVAGESPLRPATSFTPAYAAPEQCSPEKFGTPDKRTDIFQLGIVFYEMVTGELPFKGENRTQFCNAITALTPKPPSAINPEASGVERIISRCLQKKKGDRYQNITQLQSDLADFLGTDFKKSLTGSRKKTMLCCDLVEVHGDLGNCKKCILYLQDLLLPGFIKDEELQQMIQGEINALDFYYRQGVSMAERLPKLREIVHRCRMSG